MCNTTSPTTLRNREARIAARVSRYDGFVQGTQLCQTNSDMCTKTRRAGRSSKKQSQKNEKHDSTPDAKRFGSSISAPKDIEHLPTRGGLPPMNHHASSEEPRSVFQSCPRGRTSRSKSIDPSTCPEGESTHQERVPVHGRTGMAIFLRLPNLTSKDTEKNKCKGIEQDEETAQCRFPQVRHGSHSLLEEQKMPVDPQDESEVQARLHTGMPGQDDNSGSALIEHIRRKRKKRKGHESQSPSRQEGSPPMGAPQKQSLRDRDGVVVLGESEGSIRAPGVQEEHRKIQAARLVKEEKKNANEDSGSPSKEGEYECVVQRIGELRTCAQTTDPKVIFPKNNFDDYEDDFHKFHESILIPQSEEVVPACLMFFMKQKARALSCQGQVRQELTCPVSR